MLNKIKDKFSYISVIREKNKWKSMYEDVNNNFMKSSYKQVLNFERDRRTLEDAEKEILELKEKLAEATKDEEKLRAVKSIKERKKKEVKDGKQNG